MNRVLQMEKKTIKSQLLCPAKLALARVPLTISCCICTARSAESIMYLMSSRLVAKWSVLRATAASRRLLR